MSKYLIDTSIIVYTLRGINDVVEFMDQLLRDDRTEVIYSSVTEAEVYSRHLDAAIESLIEELLSVGEICEIRSGIARRAGKIRAECNEKGYKIKLPDALIAATALIEEAYLVTHNTQDFLKIKEVEEQLVVIDPFKK